MRKLASLCLVAFIALCFMLSQYAFADTSSTVNSDSDAPTSIKEDGVAFGISDMERSQTGFKKTYEGVSYGYSFPLGADSANDIVVIPLQTQTLVYIPDQVAQQAEFTGSADDQAALQKMVETLDAGLANGGKTLESLGQPYVYTSESTYEAEGITFAFNVEIEDGRYYVTTTADESVDVHSIARWCLSAKLLPADQVAVQAEKTSFQKLMAFLGPSNLDYRPLWVSLKTAAVAMIFIFILGILAARKSMNVTSRWKSLLDSIFTIPMVLPPTAIGFLLLLLFGNSTAFGGWLLAHGIELIFSWPAAVMAATVVGFPLMYRTVLGAFEALDTNMLDAARTLGWSENRIFRKLMLPLAWPSIAAGLVLAFARAMGEFGATLFVAGNYAGITQTMPIALYFAWMGGKPMVAFFWVIVIIVISFIIILIINVYSNHVQRYQIGRAHV